MNKGVIFDIKRYAIHDGPGIRTTIFFKGCPQHCPWCHNPEGKESGPELSFVETRCMSGCVICIACCPKSALSRRGQNLSIDRENCNLCGECARVCPAEALEVIGREVTVEDVMREVEKDRVFYEESCGGVTFSGGEPLHQPEFLEALLDECAGRSIHTCLDTSGYAPFEVFEKIRDKINLILYDIKMVDEERHKKATGVSNKLILENLKKLSGGGNRIIVRIPIIPGINDTLNDVTQVARFLASLDGIFEVNLLPYHEAGRQKYRNLNIPYLMDRTRPPSKEDMERFKKKLQHSGFTVKIGG